MAPLRHGLDIKATVFTWSITTDIRANYRNMAEPLPAFRKLALGPKKQSAIRLEIASSNDLYGAFPVK